MSATFEKYCTQIINGKKTTVRVVATDKDGKFTPTVIEVNGKSVLDLAVPSNPIVDALKKIDTDLTDAIQFNEITKTISVSIPKSEQLSIITKLKLAIDDLEKRYRWYTTNSKLFLIPKRYTKIFQGLKCNP